MRKQAWCSLSFVFHLIVATILLRLSCLSTIVIPLTVVSLGITCIFPLLVKFETQELTINERGDLKLILKKSLNGKLLSQSYTTNWFIWLCAELNGESAFNQGQKKKVITQIIWRDSLDNRSFRRLARVVRLKRQMI